MGALPSAAALVAALVVALPAPARAARADLTDGPVTWWADDRRDIPQPAVRDPDRRRDEVHTTIVRPLRRHLTPSILVRRIGSLFGGQVFPEAGDVNALDEVPSSTWFTNRIGLFPMTPEEVARGAGGSGPDPTGPWTIVAAKSEGVSSGFRIRDVRGDVYLVKFDPPGFPRLATGAGAISARILWAAGYHVPQDHAVTFPRSRLRIGEGVRIEDGGEGRPMTVAELDALLERVERDERGEYLAIASRFLDGTPVGPFDYRGRRSDDLNDRLSHQHRRELRGLRILAAWLNHFDTKQGNTLDMWVEEDGRRFVRHYLIDFASTLGAGAFGPAEKYGHEFGLDAPQVLGRLLTLGLHEDDWREVRRPEGLPEIGFFDVEHFDPMGFKPITPNTAFAHLTDRDGYWAAKIVTAFDDEALWAACGEAHYPHPEARETMARILAGRRDVIGRHFFARVCPIDFFTVEGSVLRGRDLGVERGLWPAESARYRVRTTLCDARRERSTEGTWRTCPRPEVRLPEPVGGRSFHAIDFQVDRGDGWSRPVTVYVTREGHRVVGVDR